MSDDVTLSLKSEGLSEVVKSLHSMREAVVNSEKESFAAVQQGAQKRLKIIQSEYKERLALLKQISKTENELNASVGKNSNGSRNSLTGSNTSNIFSNFGGSGKGISDLLGGSNGLVGLASKAGIAGAAFALVKGGVDMAVEGLKMFGSFLINDIIKPGFKLQTLAQQIENNSNGAIKAADVESRSRAIATKYNMDPSQVAETGSSFGEATGDYKLGFDATEFLAAISKSTGAKMEDLSKFANALYTDGMTIQDLKNQLLTQVGQGVVAGGKFTIKQMSSLGGGVNEPASRIAGGRDVSVASTTAMIQLAGRTSKGQDDALTNVKSFVHEVSKDKTGTYKSVLDSQGLISDPRKAIEIALIKSKGGQGDKLANAGLNSETSGSFLGAFTEDFNKAMEGKAPTVENFAKAAEYATRNFEVLTGAVATEASVRDGSTKVLNTSGEKLETMFSKLKDALAEKVMPAADKFVADFVKITPQLIEATLTLSKALIKLASWTSWFFGMDTPEGEQPGDKKEPSQVEQGASGSDAGGNKDENEDAIPDEEPLTSEPEPNMNGVITPPPPQKPWSIIDTEYNTPPVTNTNSNKDVSFQKIEDANYKVSSSADELCTSISNLIDKVNEVDLSNLRNSPLRH